MDELVIAIDGPSGVGKSSTARRVATKLRLGYLDTGAMYRAVAYECLRQRISRDDENGIRALVRNADLRITTDPSAPRVSINGRDVTQEIRQPEISAVVSAVAAVQEVRRILTAHMRQIITEQERRIVVEGRDITTVVAPDAEVRVLLTADAKARIGRRTAELGERADEATITDSIIRRDHDDSAVSNFTEAASGVVVIDSTHLSLDEVVEAVIALVPAHG
ncbi:(d)CMP kinase [Arachnia rubra]|jgi:cytidylate kinase|uniref:Cytidylate kinase n=1 Tax=Arachnia rubra TaxID=1547448 RepID=A0ABX7Y8H6_9ACTN|nr:(d)CMP kinase [Arachnia rubra]MBB1571301.1 (d)CMP kinase [Propionibacterium sp.]MDO4644315.1 (d)CMP kinase [Propionibacteriaceae bacterium]MBB1578045.1 (d)CMP kinase [Propionibacterium sp.]QUC09532.1 (d)CMP kinase [Arachnia rubra]BCR81026.1 hypothetical protein SK1NUM_14690 [Arachnia rubra]